MPETVEEVREKPEVREELAKTAGEKKPREKVKARGTDKFWFVTHALLLVGCVALYYLLGSKVIPLPDAHRNLGRRLVRAIAFVVIVLALPKPISVYGLGRIDPASSCFTFGRIE